LEVIFILIGASILVASGFLIAFLVSAKRGQFDDQHTPAIRMLFDDSTTEGNESN
jgi:cbb3-type cytochrome oxidase maturation protein